MRIAVGSDEFYDIDALLVRALEARGHEVVPFGAVRTHAEAAWVDVAVQTAGAIPAAADQAVILCWSGTGVCMAANKLPGVRAALCGDAQTARAARTWNDANVLCLSHRLLAHDVMVEILDAWLAPVDDTRGAEGVRALAALDARTRA